MENFRKYLKLEKSVKHWIWIGRIAPLTALVLLLLSLSFEPTGVTSYIIIGICITFAITAFAWWWWVIHAVKDIFNLLGEANKRFAEVIKELKQIKQDYFKKKD